VRLPGALRGGPFGFRCGCLGGRGCFRGLLFEPERLHRPFFFFEIFLFLFYFTYLTSHGEQTPGKAALGLSVVGRGEGTPIGFFRSLGRAFAYGASALPLFVGFAMAFLPGGRTLHDVLAGTMVVKEE